MIATNHHYQPSFHHHLTTINGDWKSHHLVLPVASSSQLSHWQHSAATDAVAFAASVPSRGHRRRCVGCPGEVQLCYGTPIVTWRVGGHSYGEQHSKMERDMDAKERKQNNLFWPRYTKVTWCHMESKVESGSHPCLEAELSSTAHCHCWHLNQMPSHCSLRT